jgi:DHA1 family multidrug/chloramphenicol efflux transport protein-like MFS transporter
VQEAFEERTAIRVTALMANVALIAPLIGPVAGAFMIEVLPWRMVFVFIAAGATISLIGLARHMPETVVPGREKLSLSRIFNDYCTVIKNHHFVKAAVCMPLLALPLVGWIAMSPQILVADGHLSLIEYAYWQIPVFGCLIASNMLLAYKVDSWRLDTPIKIARYPVTLSMITMLLGSAFLDKPYFLVAAVSMLSLGEGLSASVVVRFALTENAVSKATVAATMGMINMTIYGFGIEIYKVFYRYAGMMGFAIFSMIAVTTYWYISRSVMVRALLERGENLDNKN